jgi:O-antigen/teichoic acid export membrane protein
MEPRATLRGAALLSAANLAVKPAWILFLVALCPRVLGVEGFGVMQTALALATLVAAFSDLGVTNYSVREVARAPGQGRFLLQQVVVYRGALLLLAWGLTLAVGYVLGYEGDLLRSLWWAAGFVLAQSATLTLSAFLRGYQRLGDEAALTVLGRGVTIALGSVALLVTRSPVGVLAGMALALGLTAVVQGAWVRGRVVRGEAGRVDTRFLGVLALAALPIGAADALQVLYLRADQVMIEAMLGAASAGQYAQAYRLLEAMSLLPAIVIQAVLFARLARLDEVGDRQGFSRLYWRGLAGLAVAATVVAALVALVAPLLIRGLTGDPAFDASASALRVLVWTFPLTCVKDLAFFSYIARRLHRLPIALYALAAVANIGLNLWAIPRYGILGAAYATVAVEALIVAAYGIAALRRRRVETLRS